MADDNDLINRLAAAVADRIRPQIPFDYEMWDIATIAACMKLSEAQVRERLAPQPDFPKAVRLPTTSGGRGHARYRAKDVWAWMMKYQDKH
ncbi:hypothetical protein [Massilia sp. IC2-476]|uniref:hypothetical protein n=1 Tax=Massilia sp. IC2-476 TaxID=2887199 RepID=UPI001D115C8D|nr:hypothetical protein [Massilia sp. IC2-476]MCC2973267.1 hypothetical protein [Massilia sp. IC2-476]